jgi:hypothetical protein
VTNCVRKQIMLGRLHSLFRTLHTTLHWPLFLEDGMHESSGDSAAYGDPL